MKTILFILALVFSVNLSAQSVDTVKYSPVKFGGKIPYVVGSFKFPKYGDVELRTCSAEKIIILPNGREIAGIGCILFDKYEYIGGSLMFNKDTTIITDITVLPVGDGAEFKVKGKSFNMSFTLRTGLILKYENGYATFNTENKGIWTIKKRV